MNSTGGNSFLRNRRFETFFSTSSNTPDDKTPQKISVNKTKELQIKSKVELKSDYIEDDGWLAAFISYIKIITCFATMMLTTFIWALIMLLLLPWPNQRIRQGNVYGHVTGRLLVSS